MNVTIGRYLPLDSWMHKRDPRIKLGAMIIMIIALFIDWGFIGYAMIGVILLVALYASKISLLTVLKSMKAMLFMLSFLFVINLFVVKTGDLWFSYKFINIYSGAIFQSLYIAIRLILMISITTILTVTTKPLDLTMAIEDLLSPFKVIKVPAHEIAMIISIALRFIPTLLDEANRIMKAQASRGVDFDEGSLKDKILSILALIIPLFAASFQRAEELADAMEARGYSPSQKRTRYRIFHINIQDIILLIVAIITLLVMIFGRRFI